MREKLFESAEDSVAQPFVSLLAQMHIVNADEFFCGLREDFPYGIGRCCSHGDMFLRQFLIDDASTQVHVVKVEVLVEVVLISRS